MIASSDFLEPPPDDHDDHETRYPSIGPHAPFRALCDGMETCVHEFFGTLNEYDAAHVREWAQLDQFDQVHLLQPTVYVREYGKSGSLKRAKAKAEADPQDTVTYANRGTGRHAHGHGRAKAYGPLFSVASQCPLTGRTLREWHQAMDEHYNPPPSLLQKLLSLLAYVTCGCCASEGTDAGGAKADEDAAKEEHLALLKGHLDDWGAEGAAAADGAAVAVSPGLPVEQWLNHYEYENLTLCEKVKAFICVFNCCCCDANDKVPPMFSRGNQAILHGSQFLAMSSAFQVDALKQFQIATEDRDPRVRAQGFAHSLLVLLTQPWNRPGAEEQASETIECFRQWTQADPLLIHIEHAKTSAIFLAACERIWYHSQFNKLTEDSRRKDSTKALSSQEQGRRDEVNSGSAPLAREVLCNPEDGSTIELDDSQPITLGETQRLCGAEMEIVRAMLQRETVRGVWLDMSREATSTAGKAKGSITVKDANGLAAEPLLAPADRIGDDGRFANFVRGLGSTPVPYLRTPIAMFGDTTYVADAANAAVRSVKGVGIPSALLRSKAIVFLGRGCALYYFDWYTDIRLIQSWWSPLPGEQQHRGWASISIIVMAVTVLFCISTDLQPILRKWKQRRNKEKDNSHDLYSAKLFNFDDFFDFDKLAMGEALAAFRQQVADVCGAQQKDVCIAKVSRAAGVQFRVKGRSQYDLRRLTEADLKKGGMKLMSLSTPVLKSECFWWSCVRTVLLHVTLLNMLCETLRAFTYTWAGYAPPSGFLAAKTLEGLFEAVPQSFLTTNAAFVTMMDNVPLSSGLYQVRPGCALLSPPWPSRGGAGPGGAGRGAILPVRHVAASERCTSRGNTFACACRVWPSRIASLASLAASLAARAVPRAPVPPCRSCMGLHMLCSPPESPVRAPHSRAMSTHTAYSAPWHWHHVPRA